MSVTIRHRAVPRAFASAALLALVVATGSPGLAHAASSPTQAPASGAARAADNPIVRENKLPGTDRWAIPWDGYTVADDIGLQVKGYFSQVSVTAGGSISLRVVTTPVSSFSVDVYRLGWYGGLGGRLVQHIDSVAGRKQPACIFVGPTKMVTCPWNTSVRIDTKEGWVTGQYVAVMSTPDHFQSVATFVLKPQHSKAALLYVSPVNSYQAYNDFPFDPATPDGDRPQTGRSLYDFSSPATAAYPDGEPSVRVSFDRPYSSQYGGPGDGGVFDFEPNSIGYLESRGYDIAYTTDSDLDAEPRQVLDHAALYVSGHSEYWSARMYDAALLARSKGVGIAFVSSNEVYWQIRYEPNSSGMPRRIVVGYKDFLPDPVPDPALRTIRWRDLGRAEQTLVGIQFPIDGNMDWGGQAFVPTNTDHWAYAGTGFSSGHSVDGSIVGYEIDAYDPAYPKPPGTDYTLLASSPFVNFLGNDYTHNMSIYRGTGGNWVWATGTVDWAWFLADGVATSNAADTASAQQMTANVLDRMIACRANTHAC